MVGAFVTETRFIRLMLAVAVLAVAFLASAHQAATRGDTPHASGSDARARATAMIRAEFGARLTPCLLSVARRETGGTFDPRAANWSDRHSDGSYGSFGLFQIGAIHRATDEPIMAFARRMFRLRENVAVAHRLYRRSGLRPWGGYC